MVIAGEQVLQAGLLSGGEQVQTGVEGAAGPVERVGGVAAVAVEIVLDPPPALVEAIPG